MCSRVNRFASLILIFFMLFAFSGCFSEESAFPVLNFPQDNTNSTDVIIDSPVYSDNSFHEITVALPLSEDTVNYLMKLYYAKAHGIFPDDHNGLDISLEYLNAISTTWIANTITTTGEGETLSTIVQLSETSGVPDLFLTPDIESLNRSGLIVPLDSYLFDNDFLSSSIYLGALEPLLFGDGYMGLPFYSTVMMIAGNKDYLPESGIPPFSMSADEFYDFVDSIPSNYEITSVYNPLDFNEYLGDGFFEVNEEDGTDSRLSRSCGVWLMNSGEFDTWNSYYPDGLYFTMLPTDNVYATVYPLCVSSNSNEYQFAADFAAFICFDRDAQMLINRLEIERGYFPVISSPAVWEILSSDSEFGSQAMLYEQFMSNAVYSLPEGS